MQLTLNVAYHKPAADDDSQEEPLAYEEGREIDKIHCEHEVLLSNHAVQRIGSDKYDRIEFFNSKRLLFAMHPAKPLMATVGADMYLYLWDTFACRMYEKRDLKSQPTCIKWNNDGTLLVVGFINGNIVIYQLSSPQTGAGGTRGYDAKRQKSRRL